MTSNKWVAATALFCIAAAGCSSNAASEPAGGGAPPTPLKPLATASAAPSYVAFLLERPTRSQSDLVGTARALASALYGQSAPPAPFAGGLALVGPAAKSVDVDIQWQTGVAFSYRAGNDRRLVMNTAVATDTASPQDIGQAAAATLFASAFKAAVQSGVVPSTGLDPANTKNTRIIQGEGAAGQAPLEKTTEYVFTIPRTINGIEVYEAGFQASVHRTGQLARMSAFGPTVVSTQNSAGNEVPDANGYSFVATVSQSDLDSRVAAEHVNANIQPVGVRYWLPDGVASAVTEPMQMYFVVPTANIGGRKVLARGSYVAYSLRNAGAASTVWPTAEHNAVGSGTK